MTRAVVCLLLFGAAAWLFRSFAAAWRTQTTWAKGFGTVTRRAQPVQFWLNLWLEAFSAMAALVMAAYVAMAR